MSEKSQLQIDDRKEFANKLDRLIENRMSETIMALKIINDEELYVELGYDSFKDYCEERLQIKRTTAINYLRVADKFLPKGEKPFVSESVPAGTNPDFDLESPNLTGSIPFRKLRVMCVLPVEQTQRLVTEGKINIRGKEYTVDQIKTIDADQLQKIVSGGKTQLTEEKSLDLPFSYVYKIVEAYLSKALLKVYRCDELSKEDVQRIYAKIEEVGHLFDELDRKLSGL